MLQTIKCKETNMLGIKVKLKNICIMIMRLPDEQKLIIEL